MKADRRQLEAFAVRLRHLRENHCPRRSVTVVSQLMGLHPDALRRYECGQAVPSMTAVARIADFYEVTADYLLFGGEPRRY